MRRITQMRTCSTAYALNTHSHECEYKQRKASALMIITSLLLKLCGTGLDILVYQHQKLEIQTKMIKSNYNSFSRTNILLISDHPVKAVFLAQILEYKHYYFRI